MSIEIPSRAPARLGIAVPIIDDPLLPELGPEPRTGRMVAAVYDDHVIARTGLPALLVKAGIRVVDAAPVDPRIVDRGIVPRPDVAVVAGGEAGDELTRRLSEEHGVPVLRLSPTQGGAGDKLTILASGAMGAVCRRCSTTRVLQAIHTVAAGGMFFGCPHGAAEQPRPAGVLSKRERSVAAEVARGLSTEEIAESLVLSPHTVRTHIRNIQRKLGARTRAHAIAVALATQEIDPFSDGDELLGQTA